VWAPRAACEFHVSSSSQEAHQEWRQQLQVLFFYYWQRITCRSQHPDRRSRSHA
jgi:hypothetical protein